jgi:TRAP-type mannitol/chloroaromatic compound transport system permease small subunit
VTLHGPGHAAARRAFLPEVFPMQHPTSAAAALPHNRLSSILDRLVAAIGKASAWLWLAVLLVVLCNVFSRFILSRGSIALEELSWHLFGAAMMLSLGYAVVRDEHVRVDVLREKFPLHAQAWIELLGIVLLALPVIVLMIDSLLAYAHTAFVYMEHSQAPSGLPYRFVFKSVLPLGLILVAIALIARASRCSTLLLHFPRAIDAPDEPANGAHPHP